MPFKYLRICLPPIQWHFVGAALHLAKAMSSLVLFARYISAPMRLRLGYSGSSISSPSSYGRKGSFSKSNDRTTMGVLLDMICPY
jgi:hypothetical protein